MLIGKHIFDIFLSIFVIRNFGVPIEMLKGYMVRESLVTPGLYWTVHLLLNNETKIKSSVQA